MATLKEQLLKLMDTTEKCFCKSCMEEIRLTPFRMLIEKKPLLCSSCMENIKKELRIRKLFGTEILFLSVYDGLMRKWIWDYKEKLDYELAPCFLSLFTPILKLFFHGYVFLPLPSSPHKVKERGFDHLAEILKASKLPYVKAFRQNSEIEQKGRSVSDRFKTKKISLTSSAYSLKNKKVVLFDDVLTTGSTFKECYEEIKRVNPKKIYGLILMDNYHPERVHDDIIL